MSKGLDLIERQQPEIIDGFPTGNVYVGLTFEELAELEKELKVLEIIKEKRVDIYWLIKSKNLNEYNVSGYRKTQFQLTQEEYQLSKEVLL